MYYITSPLSNGHHMRIKLFCLLNLDR